jgi:predicted metal-binding membrane protein
MAVRDQCVRRATPGSLLLGALAGPPFRGPILAAAVALAAATVLRFDTYLPLLCRTAANGVSADDIVARLELLIAVNPPGSLVLAWLAMLVAMMTPLIAQPLAYVRNSSLAPRRWRAAAGFLLGYFGCWFVAGAPLLLAALALRLVSGGATAGFLCATMLALLWSAGPLHQAAQNRAHRLSRIGLFGVAADRDCVAFGATVGWWCLASCWAWMLVPFFVTTFHSLAMLAVSAIIMGERLRGPGPPSWRIPPVLALPGGWLRRIAIGSGPTATREYV